MEIYRHIGLFHFKNGVCSTTSGQQIWFHAALEYLCCLLLLCVLLRKFREPQLKFWKDQQGKKFDVHVTVHRDKFLIMNPTRCTNFTNLFWKETLLVSDSSSAYHQEFFTVHTALVYVIKVCWQLASRTFAPARKLSTNLYNTYRVSHSLPNPAFL